MDFSNFLRALRVKQNFASVSKQFEGFGGGKKLSTTLRNFQLVESGKSAPTPKLFMSVFRALPREEYKNAVIAFFESHIDSKKDSELLAFLDQQLTPAVTADNKSVFETTRSLTYTAEQLAVLSKDSLAMKLHHRVLLWERVSPTDIQDCEQIAKHLVVNALADREADGGLKPPRTVYRVPSFETSSPQLVRSASKYFKSILDCYISEEGSSEQNVSFALQLVRPNIAHQILDQMAAFKRWVQNVATSETGPGLVPFLFLSYGKKLNQKDLQ
jgi:hypothetical protein